MGCLVVLVAGLAVAAVNGALILNAWAACDVGVNAQANAMGYLLFQAPLVIGAVTIAEASAWWVLRDRDVKWQLSAMLALALAVAWIHLALVATPADYPSPFCAENVPPWWPWFLPR